MDLTPLYADDWEIIDDTETVTILYMSSGVQQEQEVFSTHKEAERKSEIMEGPARMEATYTSFHVWKEHLNGLVPTKGMKVRDCSGVIWHVEEARRNDEGWRFKLECRRDR